MIARIVTFAALATMALGKEIPGSKLRSAAAAKYESGEIHKTIVSAKESTWARQRAAGAMASEQYPELGFTQCIDGKAEAIQGDANNTFRCNNLDLYHFLSHADLGSELGEGSSSWGWTSPDGREFVALGQSDGAAFVEITTEGKLSYLGRLPHNSVPKIWREIRGYKNYMVIGSEAEGHNIQIFDMTKVLDLDPASPKTFSNDEDLTGLFTDLPIGRTHNVVVNEEREYAVAVGAAPRTDKCAAGLIFIDLTDPTNPTSPGCAAQDGYVHDAQCVVYKGPDEQYSGRDICYGYNEDTLTIYDVTDKTNTTVLSRTSYEGAAYTHQGWLLDREWQDFLVMDDEYDEYDKVGPAANGHPVTYIWDISDLSAPKQTGFYQSDAQYSVDHNQYIYEGTSYQSNYGSGLRLLDVSSIREDPTGNSVKAVAYFDIYPEDDAESNGGVIDFVGSWSSYGLFKSGYIFVNTIERGAFVVKRSE